MTELLPNNRAFIHVGTGISYAIEGDKLIIVADISERALKNAKLTNNRENLLIAGTAGNPEVEGSHIVDLAMSVNLYCPAKKNRRKIAP